MRCVVVRHQCKVVSFVCRNHYQLQEYLSLLAQISRNLYRLTGIVSGFPFQQYRDQESKLQESKPDEEVYFGHVFLINAFQIRFYLEHLGMEVCEVTTTQYSRNSVLLAPFLYPLIWFTTVRRLKKKKSQLSKEILASYKKQMLGPAALFGKILTILKKS